MDSSVLPHIPANLLLAADSMLRDGHVEAATHLLIRAEALIARVVDPQNYASLMNHADRLWRHKLIASGLRPAGISSVPPPSPDPGDVQ
jgi:hypothetical protein